MKFGTTTIEQPTSAIRPITTVVVDSSASLRASKVVSDSVRDAMTSVYEPIAEPLFAVERRIAMELQSRYEAVGEVLRHGTQLGGKRLRPAILLLAAAATGKVSEEHIVLGTVIEMVHTATLIHDDVLDNAMTRRHVQTINSRWNNQTSLLLGDYLFAQSYRLAATLPTTSAARQIGEAARLVCEGELRQVLGREQIELDEASYIEIIRGKTGELCRVACELGSEYAGGTQEQMQAMATFGDALGIAFQIADDYLDWWGSEDQVGKTLGTDVLQGKMTLPMIRLMDRASDRNRQEILDLLRGPADQRLIGLKPMLNRSDAREYTASVAWSYRNIALDSLQSFADSPAKAALQRIAEFSVERTF
jgi:octaprenyl-diphosphate synthase